MHYIITRDQWVSDEEYFTFFGSSGNLWKIERCDYPRCDFIETLRQTVQDIKENHKIIDWAGVPNMHLLKKLTESDPKFISFAEREIMPLIEEYSNLITTEKRDAEWYKQQFTKIADVTGSYKK